MKRWSPAGAASHIRAAYKIRVVCTLEVILKLKIKDLRIRIADLGENNVGGSSCWRPVTLVGIDYGSSWKIKFVMNRQWELTPILGRKNNFFKVYQSPLI